MRFKTYLRVETLKRASRAALIGTVIVSLAGCGAPSPGESAPPARILSTESPVPRSDCAKLLSEWSGVPETEFRSSPEEDRMEGLEFVTSDRRWLCLPEDYDATNNAPIVGGAMLRLDQRIVVASFLIGFAAAGRYEELGPCSQAWALAEETIRRDASAEEENRDIENTTWACMSVEEWWNSLQPYSRVFGVTAYKDSDRWSYLDAVCPEDNGADMCLEAGSKDLTSP